MLHRKITEEVNKSDIDSITDQISTLFTNSAEKCQMTSTAAPKKNDNKKKKKKWFNTECHKAIFQ